MQYLCPLSIYLPMFINYYIFFTRKWIEWTHKIVVALQLTKNKKKNWTPWPESASKLYRSSDRRLSAKLVPPQLYSRGWVVPIPDLLLRKSCSAGNGTRDLWICSQDLWSLDQRGGQYNNNDACQRSWCQLLRIEGAMCSAWRIPKFVKILGVYKH
jgi:hypothetical protein